MKAVFRLDVSEKHAQENWFYNVILGGQDGLVNVLGIVLGVAAADGTARIIIAASLAAAFAEAVSMAAVAYTSALSEKDHYDKEWHRENTEIDTVPDVEREEVRQIYRDRGFSGELLEKIVEKLTADRDVWLKTMMTDELGLRPINTQLILRQALVVGTAALLASFIPIWPFLLFPTQQATILSLTVSAVALFLVGAYEAKTYVGNWWKRGIQMIVIGLGAALVGFFIGKLFAV